MAEEAIRHSCFKKKHLKAKKIKHQHSQDNLQYASPWALLTDPGGWHDAASGSLPEKRKIKVRILLSRNLRIHATQGKG
jgi:hypothetical protein